MWSDKENNIVMCFKNSHMYMIIMMEYLYLHIQVLGFQVSTFVLLDCIFLFFSIHLKLQFLTQQTQGVESMLV